MRLAAKPAPRGERATTWPIPADRRGEGPQGGPRITSPDRHKTQARLAADPTQHDVVADIQQCDELADKNREGAAFGAKRTRNPPRAIHRTLLVPTRLPRNKYLQDFARADCSSNPGVGDE
ncbi:hypothetical protein HPB47_013684 [Ixodes persulcatus]|uniref:Uncharacterized protein n=1 Tax=Ixodes persulcatus TaxID=34615 RepID=A0AC60R1J5_IXOPE|nr:hypothetical protein HPB47_013684 [Ixodes persulcatus]